MYIYLGSASEPPPPIIRAAVYMSTLKALFSLARTLARSHTRTHARTHGAVQWAGAWQKCVEGIKLLAVTMYPKIYGRHA